MIRKPSPELIATISAATTTSHATPNPTRMPVMIVGSAPGMMTWVNSLNPVMPKFCAAQRYSRSTSCTPEVVASTIGKNDARKTRNIGERKNTQNHRKAHGSEAHGDKARNSRHSRSHDETEERD